MTNELPRLETDSLIGEAARMTVEITVGVYLMESAGKFQVTNEYRVQTRK